MTPRRLRHIRDAGLGLRLPHGVVPLLAAVVPAFVVPAIVVPAIVVPVWAAGAEAAGANECRRVPMLTEGPAPTLGRIAATGRTAFVKDGLAEEGCPDARETCRERAYLVTGDPVILTARRGDYVCATYPGARDGDDRTGWLPAGAVADAPMGALALEGWFGTWTRAEARIRLTAGTKPGALSVKGDATWGAGDPERMRRGGVHTGEIDGLVVPDGEAARFAMGEAGTVPVETADAFACKIWLRRLGPWLLVDDNLACGGANVTFRGVYRHRP